MMAIVVSSDCPLICTLASIPLAIPLREDTFSATHYMGGGREGGRREGEVEWEEGEREKIRETILKGRSKLE